MRGRAVLDGRSAVGVLGSRSHAPPQLTREPLLTVRMVTVVSPRHPLTTYGAPIPATVLAEHIQVVHTDRFGSLSSREFGMLSRECGAFLMPRLNMSFLRAGSGLAACRCTPSRRTLHSGALVQISVEEGLPESQVCQCRLSIGPIVPRAGGALVHRPPPNRERAAERDGDAIRSRAGKPAPQVRIIQRDVKC